MLSQMARRLSNKPERACGRLQHGSAMPNVGVGVLGRERIAGSLVAQEDPLRDCPRRQAVSDEHDEAGDEGQDLDLGIAEKGENGREVEVSAISTTRLA